MGLASFFTRILCPSDAFCPSTTSLALPTEVSVAPTPLVPFEYVGVFGRTAAVAKIAKSCQFIDAAIPSTYAFVAACESAVGRLLRVTWANAGDEETETSCPMLMVGVAPEPELLVIVTPVPSKRDSTYPVSSRLP